VITAHRRTVHAEAQTHLIRQERDRTQMLLEAQQAEVDDNVKRWEQESMARMLAEGQVKRAGGAGSPSSGQRDTSSRGYPSRVEHSADIATALGLAAKAGVAVGTAGNLMQQTHIHGALHSPHVFRCFSASDLTCYNVLSRSSIVETCTMKSDCYILLQLAGTQSRPNWYRCKLDTRAYLH
jgi:hypothetical protein